MANASSASSPNRPPPHLHRLIINQMILSRTVLTLCTQQPHMRPIWCMMMPTHRNRSRKSVSKAADLWPYRHSRGNMPTFAC